MHVRVRRKLARFAAVLAATAVVTTTGMVAAHAAVEGVLFSGTVYTLGPQGEHVPVSLATVTLTPMQPYEAADFHPEGEVYSDEPIAKTVTDATGHFVVNVTQVDERLRQYAEVNNGYLNFVVFASRGIYAPNAGDAQPVRQPLMTGTDMVYATVDASGVLQPVSDAVTENEGAVDVASIEMQAAALQGLVGSTNITGVNETPSGCNPNPRQERVVLQRTTSLDIIAQVHVGEDSAATVTYGDHSDYDVSGAYNAGGKGWKFTAGFAHQGNKGSTIEDGYYANEGWSVLSKYRFRKDKVQFRDQYTHDICYWQEEIQPEGWTGGTILNGKDRYRESTYDNLVRAKNNNTRDEYGNSGKASFQTVSAESYTYTTEVSAFGVGLKGKSHYGSELKIRWTFGHSLSRNHWLYHPTKDPRDAPAVFAW